MKSFIGLVPAEQQEGKHILLKGVGILVGSPWDADPVADKLACQLLGR
jgi:hypothetical protein